MLRKRKNRYACHLQRLMAIVFRFLPGITVSNYCGGSFPGDVRADYKRQRFRLCFMRVLFPHRAPFILPINEQAKRYHILTILIRLGRFGRCDGGGERESRYPWRLTRCITPLCMFLRILRPDACRAVPYSDFRRPRSAMNIDRRPAYLSLSGRPILSSFVSSALSINESGYTKTPFRY